MQNSACIDDEMTVPETAEPILEPRSNEDLAKPAAKLVESIVDRQLAIGSMPA